MRILMLCLLPFFVQAQSTVNGNWQGKINGSDLYIAIDENMNQVDLSVPSQGLLNMKSTSLEVNDSIVSFYFSTIQAHFQGVFDGQNVIGGTWKQGFTEMPITLTRAEKQFTLLRPQTPSEPFPYESEQFTFYNQKDDINFVGTITKPAGDGPFPTVILISGSGPQDRDGTIFGHKTLWVLADYLTRNGYAVLRYDERGVGMTNGNFQSASSSDFVEDINFAIKHLVFEKYIDSDRIGLIGHSEGGLVAAMTAAQNDEVDFIVSLAGPGQKGSEILSYQLKRNSANMGLSKDGKEKMNAFLDQMISQVQKQEKMDNQLEFVQKRSTSFFSKLTDEDKQLLGGNDRMFAFSIFNQFYNPWMKEFLTTDPVDYWKQVDVPVLAINGGRDKQVVAKPNLSAIKTALKEGGNEDYTVKRVWFTNHLLQKSWSGEASEYALIETTIEPKVLDKIVDWLDEQNKEEK